MYRLTGQLEQGQLADLFRGERVEAHEPVVIKLFHLKTSDAAYAKVVAEVARALQAVAHPGVARVLDVGLIDGQLAVVRQDAGPYTLGLALQRLNTREVILPPALALALAIELLDAMGAAHAAGVVHSGLTPGNIVLGEDGRVSVADFGALTALQASAPLKKSFAARGRDSYRAPELGAGDAATVASDVYALGAITYELLTLREASTGHSAISTRSERLPPPSRLVRRLHSRVDPLVMRALESSPTRRHKSCAEFAEGLREFLAASGGVPGREDLKKFVGELFPNEVQLAAAGPVPFERAFELTDIAGVGAIEADAVEVAERPSFSGGRVDDRTPTSDGLPVFTEADLPAAATQTEVEAVAPRAVSTWDAPAASPEAQAGPTPQLAAEPLKNRVKVVEDFAELPGQARPPPKPSRRQRVAKTIMTFAVPFKREGDPVPPSYEAMHRRGARQVKVVSFLSTVILMGVVFGTIYTWVQSQNDPKGALISYLPDPIERALAPENKPLPPRSSHPVKLADFDKLHPELAFNPDPNHPKEPPAQPPPPVVHKDPPAVKKNPECYDAAPKGKVAYLTVESPIAVRVEIDGKRVCVAANKLPVPVGSHRVAVIDPRSKQEYASTTRFEAGKLVKLSPVFQKR